MKNLALQHNSGLSKQSFVSTAQLSSEDLQALFSLARQGKASQWREYSRALSGKTVALLFFQPSLRTRTSFQAGISRLGGQSAVLQGAEIWGIEYQEGAIMDQDKAEHVKEAAMVLSSYFDLVGIRSFAQMSSWDEDRQDLVINAFQKFLTVPLVSLESALFHPCQALADGFTLQEHFGSNLRGKTFALTWANHPKQLPMAVPNSSLLLAAQLGMQVRLVCPEGYLLSQDILKEVSATSLTNGGSFEVYHNQSQGLYGVDVVYAKSWTPPTFIGKPALELSLRSALTDWRIDGKKMSLTAKACFMHCLPLRRNVVATDEVVDSKQSLIAQQAANRLHLQNAIMLSLLGND